MKRNKQSKINLFLTRITICFLTAIGNRCITTASASRFVKLFQDTHFFTENPVDFSENRKIYCGYIARALVVLRLLPDGMAAAENECSVKNEARLHYTRRRFDSPFSCIR